VIQVGQGILLATIDGIAVAAGVTRTA
jgi:hypothetical protein